MIDENSLGYLPLYDPNHSQAYINAMNAMDPVDNVWYKRRYHHSILDDDNVNDSIKIKVLYNELMTLKDEFSNTERRLNGEISYLQAENKKLSDEIASIKQALYFG